MQRSAANFMAVDCRNGPVAFSVVAHFDKSKASGLSRVAVRNDVHMVNRPMSFKQRTDVLFAGAETEISYKNTLHLILLSGFESGKIRVGEEARA